MVAIVELEQGEGLVATGQSGGNEATAQRKCYSDVTCAPCSIESNHKSVGVLLALGNQHSLPGHDDKQNREGSQEN